MEAIQSREPARPEFRSSMQGSAILPKKRMVRMALDEQMANETRANAEKTSGTSPDNRLLSPRSNNTPPESVPIPIQEKVAGNHLPLGQKERGVGMDECAAAMVLMSLSCSPRSPTSGGQWPLNPAANRDASSAWSDRLSPASTTSSSGVASYNAESMPSPPFAGLMPDHPNHHTDPYGGHYNHHPAHYHGHHQHGRFLQPVDEGILMDSGGLELDASPKEETRIGYKCTWKGCGFLTLACAEVERHIRDVHLGPRNDDSEEDSDNEVEFYYTEVEVSPGDLQPPSVDESVDPWQQPINLESHHYHHPQHQQLYQQEESVVVGSVQESQSYFDSSYNGQFQGGLYASSAPATSHMEMARPVNQVGLDLRQQQQGQDQQFVMVGGRHVPKSNAVPISMPQRGGSWHPYGGSPMSPHKFARFSPKTGSSPKITSHGRPRRTESKKCRKVYGLDNKDNWCTQCKWKKACTRFNE